MNEFKIGKKTYKIASCFDELNRRQIEAYVKDVYLEIPKIFGVVDGKTKILDPQLLEEKYMALFIILLNFDIKLANELIVPRPVLDDAGEVMRYEDGQVMMYSNAQFLIFTNQVCNFFFESFLTKNPVPHIQPLLKGRKLYGPADNFKNIRIEEYFYADKLYLAYRNTNNEQFLDRLVAAIYRYANRDVNRKSPTYDGDKREPFNEHHLLGRASLMKEISFDTKYLIHVWYEGCRNQLVRDFPLLYTGGSEGTYTLKPEEELVSLCGGWEKYNSTKHLKLRLLFNDLHANAKRNLQNKKP